MEGSRQSTTLAGARGAWWRGIFLGLDGYPSTTLRLVPLPIFDGEELEGRTVYTS